MFSISVSHNRMFCIEIENPSEKEREILKSAVIENRIDHPAYIAKQPGCPFIQSDHENYILIEFWGKDPEPFLEYVNSLL